MPGHVAGAKTDTRLPKGVWSNLWDAQGKPCPYNCRGTVVVTARPVREGTQLATTRLRIVDLTCTYCGYHYVGSTLPPREQTPDF